MNLHRDRRRHGVIAPLTALAVAASSFAVAGAPTVEASSTIENSFDHTGSTETFTVPAGVTAIDVTIAGGQGGRGGHDSQGSPETGGYQGVVTGTIPVTPGEEITVAVGGGGGQGQSSSGSASGGSAGQNPLAGYDGAVGGVAGPLGSSGGGGGSGAASVLRIGGVDVVAGGAGGNGGSGQFEPIVGRRAEGSHQARPDVTSTDGRPGLDAADVCNEGHRCDGGASGAGGGGAVGGEHGQVQYGGATATEYFGFGGFPGANATGGFAGLTATYDFYEGNGADGSITITYDDGAPGAPTGLAATAGTGEIDLTWTAPLSSGGDPITDYVIEYATSASGPYAVFADGTSTTTSTTVTGLTNGTEYFFRVAAVNSLGTGPTTPEMSVGTVPSDVPDAPSVSAVTPTDGGLLVDVVAGASDSPITGWQYRLDGGSWRTASIDADRITVDGLVNGRAYSVEVRTRNSIGTSAASAPAVSGTPVGAPSAPTSVSVTSGDGAADLTWSAPSNDNGSALTGYVVEQSTDPSGPFTTAVDASDSLATTASVSGLSNGTTYYFRVAAVNAVGAGTPSTAVSASPYTVPGAPTIDSIAPGDGQLVVEIASGGDGGSAITGWDHRLDGGPWRTSGSTDTTFTIGGLDNGRSYDVEVRARNVAGVGPASDVVTATPRTVPAAPAISTVALDTGAVSVSFSTGADGGSPVTNVEYSIDGGDTWTARSPESAASPITIGELVGGETYPVAVRLVNAAGTSDASNISSVTAKGTPEAPGIADIVPGDRRLTLSISTPANGGSTITNYEYSLDGGNTWTPRAPESASTSLIVTGLDNGTPYDVALRAINAAGSGAASDVSTATPRATPSAPTIDGDTIAGTDGVLDVAFTAPASDGGSAITGYEYSTDAGATWQPRVTGTTESPLEITALSTDGTTALVGGESYPVEIRAVNAAGAGTASAVATGITTTVPDAPVIDAVTTDDGTATIEFTTPANGGSTILRFEYRLDDGAWTDTGTLAETFTIDGLVNSTTYSIELRAVNAVGAGPASSPATASVVAAPGAPVVDDVTAGDGTLTVTFIAGGDGGAALTGYEYSTDGGATWRARATGTTGSPLVIGTDSAAGEPLVNGTVYTVQLRALNSAGPGAASVSTLIAPLGVPAAPSIDGIDADDGALAVRFTPGSDGGSSVTDVQFSLDGGAWTSAGALASPITIDGLDNGRSYDVALRAVSAAGDGAASSTASGTPRTVPGTPGDVGASGDDGAAIVTWSAPSDDGGSAVSAYEVTLWDASSGGSAVGSCATDGALTCTITGLDNGTTVHASVTAVNAAGSGAATSPRVAVTPVAVPTVTGASVSPQSTSVVVELTVDDGGAEVTGLEYRLDGGSWTAADDTSSVSIDGLVRGQSYEVEVRATNAAGTGPASDPVTAIPHTVPDAPSGVAATGGPGEATVTWSAPDDDGGQSITDYVVEYATDPEGPFTSFDDGESAAISATVTGLDDATTYVFRVRAVNTAGSSGWSSLASATPLSPPAVPTITTTTPGSKFIRFTFVAPVDDGGSPITGYEYSLDGGEWRSLSGMSSPLTITGLDNGVEYDVAIRAVNAVGGSAASDTVSVTPFGLPGDVGGFVAVPDGSPGGSQVELSWDPADDNGSEITSYNLVRWSAATEGSIADSATTAGTSRTFTGLDNGTYYFTIEATNAAGTGPRTSPRLTATVGGTVPDAPTIDTLEIDGTEADLAWTVSDPGSSAVTGHIVQYSTDGSTFTTLSHDEGSSATVTLPSVSVPVTLRVAAISTTGRGAFTTITPPTVSSAGAGAVTTEGASLGATITPAGEPVTVTAEVATDAADLGTDGATAVDVEPATVSDPSTAVAADAVGLDPGTTYVARLTASAGAAVVHSELVTFTTRSLIESTNLDRTYDSGPIAPLTVTTPAGLTAERTYEGIDGTDYGPTSEPPTAVGTYQVTTVIVDDVHEGSETATLTIAPEALDAVVTATDRAYDGTTAVDLAGDLVGVVSGDDVTLVDGALTGELDDPEPGVAKEVTVSALDPVLTGDDAGNYTVSVPASTTVTIDRAPQTLTFTSAAPSSPNPGMTYEPTVVSDRGLEITVAVSPASADVCSISDGAVALGAVGRCTIVATSEGSPRYLAADAVEQHVDVVAADADDGGTGDDGSGDDGGTGDDGSGDDIDGEVRVDIDLAVGASVGGALVVVETTGLEPRSDVRIELHSDPVLLGTARTDGDGDLRTEVRLPDELEPGLHHVVVVGTDRDGAEITVTEPLTVDWSGARASDDATGGFVAVDPVRVLDTRRATAVAAGETHQLAITPAWDVPSNATAVTLNVTATRPDAAGYVTVHPCGADRPEASLLNVDAGRTMANLAVVGIDDTRELCIYSSVGTDVLVDLNGVHVETGGDRLGTHVPTRIVDTRDSSPLAAGQVLEVPVADPGTAGAAVLNLTVDDPEAAGFLTAFPCGGDVPEVSNLNFEAGDTIANGANVKLGGDGSVCIYTSAATDLLIDVTGTFSATGDSSLSVHVPGRMLDTRGGSMVAAGTTLSVDMVGDGAAPMGTTAMALNVTAVGATRPGHLTVYPCGAGDTGTSNLNIRTGGAVANHVTAHVDDEGRTCILTSVDTHLVIDVEGTYRSS